MTAPRFVIDATRTSGTRSGGYWQAACDMERPWVATINGRPLIGRGGKPRRFSTKATALAAAEASIVSACDLGEHA